MEGRKNNHQLALMLGYPRVKATQETKAETNKKMEKETTEHKPEWR